MKFNAKKVLLTAGKLLLAAVLVAWVCSMARWDDSVEGKDGAAYSVLAAPASPQDDAVWSLAGGHFWSKTELTLKTSDLKSTPDAAGNPLYVKPGVKSSVQNLVQKPRSWGLVALAVAAFMVAGLILSVRYWLLLRIQDIYISRFESLRLTFLGMFFNYFMPGSVGGDLVKAYYVAKHTPRKAAVLVSVFVDRMLGLTELVVLASVMIAVALLLGEKYDSLRMSVNVVMVVVVLVAGGLTFVLSARFRRLFHLQKIYQRMSFAHHIEAAGDAAQLYRTRWLDLLKAIGITFGAQAFSIASIWLLGMALEIEASGINYFVYVPMIWIIGAIPLSPGGAGLIESLYITFFASAKVSASKALVLALLGRFVQMAASLPGLIVYFGGAKVPKDTAIEAELEGENGAGTAE